MIDLSIVVVSYNTRELTSECVKSVIKNTKKIKYEILVIDNGSSDGSLLLWYKLDIDERMQTFNKISLSFFILFI